jgi:hypothetical protein
MNATTTQHGMLLRNNHSVRQGTAQIATDFGLHCETKIKYEVVLRCMTIYFKCCVCSGPIRHDAAVMMLLLRV